uniref:Uncharacterized protein n=1 Tax=Sphaerodactylus townsendi TaxID=933632 RepID=A0ACB8ELC1_9SAUR
MAKSGGLLLPKEMPVQGSRPGHAMGYESTSPDAASCESAEGEAFQPGCRFQVVDDPGHSAQDQHRSTSYGNDDNNVQPMICKAEV